MSTIRGKSLRMVALLLRGAALVAPLAASPALAQAGASDETETGDIIVTAQRRSEKLEEVPMTVAVISAETLANCGVVRSATLPT